MHWSCWLLNVKKESRRRRRRAGISNWKSTQGREGCNTKSACLSESKFERLCGLDFFASNVSHKWLYIIIKSKLFQLKSVGNVKFCIVMKSVFTKLCSENYWVDGQFFSYIFNPPKLKSSKFYHLSKYKINVETFAWCMLDTFY